MLSQGRSGTAFLADLLARAPGTLIRHEWPGDPAILGLSRSGRFERVVEEMLEKRFEAVLPEAGTVDLYGEVNSLLRYNAGWLTRRFDPVLLHVTRDGRDFARSAYERDVHTAQHRQLPIVPEDGDPYTDEWPRMSRFERICWIWRHTNEMLGASVSRHARFEDLVASYPAFRAALLEPTGLELDEASWRRAVVRPRNTSAKYRGRRLAARLLGRGGQPGERLPHWSSWSDELTTSFWRICGPTMERFGYSPEPAQRDSGSAVPRSTED